MNPGSQGEDAIEITISIVSHGQSHLIQKILADLQAFADDDPCEVILTLNVPERLPFTADGFSFPLTIVENTSPKGFGANHNAAFRLARGEWFCVLNPDIRLPANPFPGLLAALRQRPSAVVAPAVLSPAGAIEDSIRRFPTPLFLIAKSLGKNDGRYRYALDDAPFPADWVAGMCMLFRAEDFRQVGGFDEGFFLYYEDVDICARLWKGGLRVMACPAIQVIHDARRASRRDPRYMRWHVASLLRYLAKHWLRTPATTGR